MDAETIQLILDMGASGANVEEVRKRLEGLKGSVASTADSYEVLERQVGEYEVLERRVAEATREVVQAQAVELDMLEQLGIRTEVAAASAGRAGKSLGRDGDFGRGIMQASFAVQDFTSVLGTQGLGRAIGSIQNNIPILVTALGAGAGLAGVISIVSVGIGLLIDNWDKITARWKGGETEKETERQKELAKAIDATRQAAEKLAATHPREQREEEGTLKKAVDEFGGQAVLKELEAALKAKQGSFGVEADRKMAENFFANLMQGNRSAWNQLKDLDLRGDVGDVLRGGMTPKEREAANARREEREAKERDAARKEKLDEENRRIDALNRQGEQNEEAGRRQAEADRKDQAKAQQAQHVTRPEEAGMRDQIRANLERQQGLRARRELAQQGIEATPQQALAIQRAQQQALERAQQDFVRATLEAASGQAQQIEMLRQAARAMRQRNQPANNGGWN